MESVGSQVCVGQVTSAVSGSQQLAADTALPLENMNLASRISDAAMAATRPDAPPPRMAVIMEIPP